MLTKQKHALDQIHSYQKKETVQYLNVKTLNTLKHNNWLEIN